MLLCKRRNESSERTNDNIRDRNNIKVCVKRRGVTALKLRISFLSGVLFVKVKEVV